ncbi:mannose/fructose-specific phosphotransferase system component IIA [Yokenella regensburgei]|jgi:mannose/fructose-specific phosphotransferase system component IIA|uniref:Mannose/fructose-specific phosphotransferase system component IIA n=1 Tax=Yokenella regensburgei TaxID=158877 RepID=A0ABX9S4F2_9ENTR|nr:PTS fructose transporter subunit IIA [Yokenella regensburgei]KAF1369002.1 mannose/fructose-specific phosphotransferase system component IIA [Yokenella regensburgei]RKR64502.1 mannose/fructose-specific phosphotransferase system component IIA [Yokenella regensburgei]VFS17749.1 EIIAB-Man [Yokenella regensburgei]
MNQLLLISHGGFASGARQATELILGAQPNLHVVELDGEKGITVFKQELRDKITALSTAESNIIILSDLKSGSPYNSAMEIIVSNNLWDNITLLSGMNLNLILEIAMAIDENHTPASLNEIITTARDGIYHLQQAALAAQTDDGDE